MSEILSSQEIGRRVFFPRVTDLSPTHEIDVGDTKLGCYCRNPYEGAATVVYFHGNGELAAEYYEEISFLFLNSKLNVCFVEYRGYGKSKGNPDLVKQLDDNVRILDELNIPHNNLIVFGRSLGSLFAIDLAYRCPDIAGLIVESGIAEPLEDWSLDDVVRQLGRTEVDLRKEVDKHFNNQRKLASYKGEFLVLHAEKDQDVNISHAQRLHSWCETENKKLVVFTHGDHNTILFRNILEYANELELIKKRIENGMRPGNYKATPTC